MRIQGSISSGMASTAGGAGAPAVPLNTPHPLSVLLFGKRPPRPVDRRRHPKLRKALRKLEAVKDQIAESLGAAPGELSLELCEGENACISRDGKISVGVELLEKHGEDDDLMVAVLGHEIGHQPWSWPEGEQLRGLSRAGLEALYREEEAKADRFAGRVLAELGADPAAVCEFLQQSERFEAHPPRDYYPAKTRAAMIRGAYAKRRRALRLAQALRGEVGPRLRDLR